MNPCLHKWYASIPCNTDRWNEIPIMTKDERWNNFITELREYVEEHHLGPSKHTALYNQCRYYRKKLKEGSLDTEKARE